jgi:hypothetical protein
MQDGKRLSLSLLLVLYMHFWTLSAVDALIGIQAHHQRVTPRGKDCHNIHKHRPSRFLKHKWSKYGIQQFRLAALRDDDDDDHDDEREYASVRRRSRRSRPEREYNDDQDTTGRQTFQEDDDYDQRYQNYEEDYEWVNDLLDNDDDDDDEPVYGLFGNEIIPNELLDNIDPDGAADRFPELARDPRFWFDMFLFVAFLDFLSWVGPRDPFPDLPPL